MASLYRDQNPKIFSQDLFTESATQKHPLGTKWRLNDGREFIYCKNGADALVTGIIVQAPASLGAQHVNQAVAVAAAIGATSVTVTLGSTAVAANYYKDGYLLINDAAGEGYTYKIKSHPAALASANVVLTLYDSIRVALTTSSEYTLVCHPCKGVIIAATTQTGKAVGATQHAVTAAYYFWAQCRGAAAVMTQGTVVIGQPVICSASAAGAVTPILETTLIDIVGKVLSVNATTEHSCIDLMMS